MSKLINDELRRQVAERAEFLCEYCVLHEEDGFYPFQVDHIISRKHDGPTILSNLAFACPVCNRLKGSDLGTISRRTGVLTRFFNPRTDAWNKHFRINGREVEPLTDIAEGTARILAFDHEDRLLERAALIASGRFRASPLWRAPEV
jgi:hypothetical protein